MAIDDTTRRMAEDPAEGLLFLADGMATGGAESFILGQEKRGQQQLVNSDRLPSKFHGDRAEWEALGFTFGDPDPDDPLFMPATLPPGWKRQATDHSMGSVIVDQLGRERVSIFYKAAFYDRSAHMNLVSVAWYVTKHVEYDGPMVISGEWATRDAVIDAMRQHAGENRSQAAEFRGYAGDAKRRDADNRRWCATHADEQEATAAKYDAAIAGLGAT
jgi:hypothetical protein